jgi:hypothetical protein
VSFFCWDVSNSPPRQKLNLRLMVEAIKLPNREVAMRLNIMDRNI